MDYLSSILPDSFVAGISLRACHRYASVATGTIRGVWILAGAEPGAGVCYSESTSARLHGAAGLQRAVGFDNADRAAFSCFVGHESTIAVLVRSWAFGACFCRAALPAVCAFQFWIAAGAAGLSSAGGTELQPANADTGMVRGISCVRCDLRRHYRQQKEKLPSFRSQRTN